MEGSSAQRHELEKLIPNGFRLGVLLGRVCRLSPAILLMAASNLSVADQQTSRKQHDQAKKAPWPCRGLIACLTAAFRAGCDHHLWDEGGVSSKQGRCFDRLVQDDVG